MYKKGLLLCSWQWCEQLCSFHLSNTLDIPQHCYHGSRTVRVWTGFMSQFSGNLALLLLFKPSLSKPLHQLWQRIVKQDKQYHMVSHSLWCIHSVWHTGHFPLHPLNNHWSQSVCRIMCNTIKRIIWCLSLHTNVTNCCHSFSLRQIPTSPYLFIHWPLFLVSMCPWMLLFKCHCNPVDLWSAITSLCLMMIKCH